jgi:hypothetical protein
MRARHYGSIHSLCSSGIRWGSWSSAVLMAKMGLPLGTENHVPFRCILEIGDVFIDSHEHMSCFEITIDSLLFVGGTTSSIHSFVSILMVLWLDHPFLVGFSIL